MVGHVLIVHTCSFMCTNHIGMIVHTQAFEQVAYHSGQVVVHTLPKGVTGLSGNSKIQTLNVWFQVLALLPTWPLCAYPTGIVTPNSHTCHFSYRHHSCNYFMDWSWSHSSNCHCTVHKTQLRKPSHTHTDSYYNPLNY